MAQQYTKQSYLAISEDSDTLTVGVDMLVNELKDHDCIVWCNRGLYGVIKSELVQDMLRHVKNILDHPRSHTGKASGLVFYWEQVQVLKGKPTSAHHLFRREEKP